MVKINSKFKQAILTKKILPEMRGFIVEIGCRKI
jgi:hypothetical protein